MKVSNGYNSYAYQQQGTNPKHKGKSFSDMFSDLAANKTGITDTRVPKDDVAAHMRQANPHMCNTHQNPKQNEFG